MKLVSLEIFPKGNNGWKSEKLEFGCHITQLYGPNGCGKAPIVQSIAWGIPVFFEKTYMNDVTTLFWKLKLQKAHCR